ncbi:contactin-4-like isoform X2 [Haliotis asinina]|uniref:contactin-4-like isoform X2 n=1 Tax=Haliotis asinina TaxID=109174 RepID=UPI003532243D
MMKMIYAATFILFLTAGVISGAPSASPVLSALSDTARFSWEIPQGGLGIGFTFYAVSPAGDTVFVVFDDGTFEPPANYKDRLVYQGNIAARNVTFTLSNIQTSDAGTYTCGNGGTNSVVQNCGQKLVVLGKPTTPGRPVSTTPVYNQLVTLICSSTSTTVPGDHGLTLAYTWQRDNTDITTASPGSPYVFTVSSRDSHSYRCRARESQGLESEWSQVYNMEPEYGPYQISLTPSTSSYIVTEQQALPSITCSALCRPGCSYRWLHNGTAISSGAVLQGQADRSKTGSYRCQPSNTHGSSESVTVTVDVQYPADISMFTVNCLTGSVTVNESDTVTFRCQIDSNPKSVVRLLNGSGELIRADTSLIATYRLDSADCRQRGNYSCTATNNIGTPVSQMVELLVICSPRLDDSVSKQLTFAATLSGDVIVSVSVLAYPLPTFTWSRSISTSQDLTGSSSPVSDIAVSARLHLTNLQHQDFGDYSLKVDNGDGASVTYTVSIEPADPPAQQKRDAACTVVVSGATVGTFILTLLIGGIVLMVLYRKGYRIGKSLKGIYLIPSHPDPVEMDNRGYSSLDQVIPPVQYSNLEEESETQQYTQLKMYEDAKADAATDTRTYEGVIETLPVTYESIRASPYQNTGVHSQGPDHENN